MAPAFAARCARLVEVFGGTPGLRDAGLLESVLFRPRSGHYRDLSEMARALFESLIMNHPFVDGNERVAFFAFDTFLRLNGWKPQVEPAEAHAFLSRLLEEGECDTATSCLGFVRRSFAWTSQEDRVHCRGGEAAPKTSPPAPSRARGSGVGEK